jgi:hypothetical protein
LVEIDLHKKAMSHLKLITKNKAIIKKNDLRVTIIYSSNLKKLGNEVIRKLKNKKNAIIAILKS